MIAGLISQAWAAGEGSFPFLVVFPGLFSWLEKGCTSPLSLPINGMPYLHFIREVLTTVARLRNTRKSCIVSISAYGYLDKESVFLKYLVKESNAPRRTCHMITTWGREFVENRCFTHLLLYVLSWWKIISQVFLLPTGVGVGQLRHLLELQCSRTRIFTVTGQKSERGDLSPLS